MEHLVNNVDMPRDEYLFDLNRPDPPQAAAQAGRAVGENAIRRIAPKKKYMTHVRLTTLRISSLFEASREASEVLYRIDASYQICDLPVALGD